MANPLVVFFRTGPDRAPRLGGPDEVDRTYRGLRARVFWSLTLGYAWFYVARVNFSVVKKPLLDEQILTGTEMGLIGSAMLGVYAVGKLLNGFLADHANIRRFLSAALAGSAIVNLAMGCASWPLVFLALWALNGWFQSVGSAASVVSLAQWFSGREFGTRYGLWSVSHSIGEGLSFVATAAVVSWLGWRWGFWWPGLACLGVAFFLSRTLADRPATYGLPPVSVWRKERTSSPSEPIHAAAEGSVWAAQREVLRHSAIWVLGLAGATMSATRYGVMHWGMLYLQEGKGYSMNEAGSILSVYPVAALAGAALSGVISDRFFGARRNVPALGMGLLVSISLFLLAQTSSSSPLLDTVIMAVFGFNMGGLLTYLGGLMAVDLSPKRAAGAAMGVIGVFCYVGAAIQDTVSGWLVDRGRAVLEGVVTYDFQPLLAFWLVCSLASIGLTLLVWKSRPRE